MSENDQDSLILTISLSLGTLFVVGAIITIIILFVVRPNKEPLYARGL